MKFAVILFFALVTSGDPIEDVKMTDFKFRGNGFQLEGEHGKKKGNKFWVTNARLIWDKDDLIVIETPEFEYDLVAKRGHSKAKVRVRTRKFILRGQGFVVDTKAGRVIIQSKVHMTIIGQAINF